MSKFRKRLTFIVLFAAATGLSHGEGEAITYTYTGTCATLCDGFPPGGGVSGSISFLDAALIPGNPYPAPTSFALHFGSVEISSATADSFGLFAYPPPAFPGLPQPAIVPVDLTTFVATVQTGEDPVAPATGADGIIITPVSGGAWFATANGNCNDAECHFIFVRGNFVEGTGAWSTGAPPTGVPAPATLFLLAPGLLGLAFMMRGRGHRTRG